MDALDCKTFSVSGAIKEKPDMLFCVGNEWFVMEIKPGIGGKSTRRSDKIIEYYHNHQRGFTDYSINDEIIFPKIFLVGSYFSPEGRIFDNETIKPSRHTVKERRLFGCPDFEFYGSHVFIRTIWDRWMPIKNKEYAIGALLSDKLNGGKGKPLIFIQEFNKLLNKWLPPHTTWILGKTTRWRPCQ